MRKQKTQQSVILRSVGLFAQALTVAGVLAFSGMIVQATDNEAKVKHVILFIGDGMHLEHEIAASRYLTGRDYGLVWDWAEFRAPVSTWDVTTYNRYALAAGVPPYSPTQFDPVIGYSPALGGSWPFPLDSTIDDAYFLTKLPDAKGVLKYPATDSASAGTAWATGYKTDDGNLAWLPGDPAGGSLKTIAEYARDMKGAAIGVVSTVPFTHATPAAHVSHNVSRNNYSAIGDEILLTVQPDVVIGGGHPLWSYRTSLVFQYQTNLDGTIITNIVGTNYAGNYMSLKTYATTAAGGLGDYVFVERQPGMPGGPSLLQGALQAATIGKKLFGLFGGSGGNFESPQPVHAPRKPQVMPGSTENPTLQEATLAALQVLSRDPDGFFVMIEQGDIDWSNHANDFRSMVGCTFDLNEAVKAAIGFVSRPGDDVDWSNTLLIVTSDHGNSYMRLKRNRQGVPVLGRGELPEQLPNTEIVGDYAPAFVYPDGEVTYGSPDHSNELVMLYAWGKGINFLARAQGDWYSGANIIDNTQIFHVMMQALGLQLAP